MSARWRPEGRARRDVDPALAAHVSGQLETLPFAAERVVRAGRGMHVPEARRRKSRRRSRCAAGVRASPVSKKTSASLPASRAPRLMSVRRAVLEHGRLEALAFALLAGGGDDRQGTEVGVDDTGAVAGGAGTSELALNSAALTPWPLRTPPGRVEHPE